MFRDIRDDAALDSKAVLGPRYDDLRADMRGDFLNEFTTLAERHNPVARRVVRRTRPMLEDHGLLKRIGVITHPRGDDGLPPVLFTGEGGLVMSIAFNAAYEAAEAFSRSMQHVAPVRAFQDDPPSAYRVVGTRGSRNRAPYPQAYRCFTGAGR